MKRHLLAACLVLLLGAPQLLLGLQGYNINAATGRATQQEATAKPPQGDPLQAEAAVAAFDKSSLKGQYVSSSALGCTPLQIPIPQLGQISAVAFADARISWWTFDGNGKFTRRRTYFNTGGVTDTREFFGSYMVNASGEIALSYKCTSGLCRLTGFITDTGDGFVFAGRFTENILEAVEAGYARKSAPTNQQFSTSSLKGQYTFSSFAAWPAAPPLFPFIPSGPGVSIAVARTGKWDFDGNGNFTRNTIYNNTMGGTTEDSRTGKYTVDLLGQITIDSRPYRFTGVLTDNGGGFLFAGRCYDGLPSYSGVEAGNAGKSPEVTLSSSSLSDQYAFSYIEARGIAPLPAVIAVEARVGRLQLDGNSFLIKQDTSYTAQGNKGQTLEGTYSLDPSGTISLSFNDGAEMTGTITGSGEGVLLAVRVGTTTIQTGYARRVK
jgi:hypothetical protein